MRALALLLALLCACVPAPDPAAGVVRVGIGPSLSGAFDWRADQRAAIVDELAQLAALGPEWRLTSEGEADVVVRAADLSASGACGRFVAGEAFVEVDAACAQGLSGLARAAGHELTHWLTWTRWRWLGHLCDWPLDAPVPPGCHPLRRCPGGDCLMAPGLAPLDDSGPTTTEVYTAGFVDPAPAQPDVDLVRACRAAERCE